MFLLCTPAVSQRLERLGFLCRWRASMTVDLGRLPPRRLLPEQYRIVEWQPHRRRDVALVDHRAFRGTLDARLYREYFSTPQGCERMWREAIEGKFGRFDPFRTLLLLHEGRVCGDVMVSARHGREAFIGNLAVVPEHQGRTGSALLLECLWRCREAGYERVSLAVTEENRRAYSLYERVGFVVSARFPLVARCPASPSRAAAEIPGSG